MSNAREHVDSSECGPNRVQEPGEESVAQVHSGCEGELLALGKSYPFAEDVALGSLNSTKDLVIECDHGRR